MPLLATEPGDLYRHEYSDYQSFGERLFPHQILASTDEERLLQLTITDLSVPAESARLPDAPEGINASPICSIPPDAVPSLVFPFDNQWQRQIPIWALLFGTFGTDGRWHDLQVLDELSHGAGKLALKRFSEVKIKRPCPDGTIQLNPYIEWGLLPL
ncbi:MAG TPA: hypothetical protein VLW83_03435 [Candidatus Acidoferrales bacterium]|nr:hypothetical protein [Candidatus Acidoferrum sp.]HUJ80907.1 hypothetical protein [Candidatus Acidoferrales bacterium]